MEKMMAHADTPVPCGIFSESIDVIIVGGGLCGTLAAIMLGRSGLRVVLIDVYDSYPADFRAEQLVGSQVKKLESLELLDVLVGDTVPAGQAVATRAGKMVGVTPVPHYGISYERMINRARARIPSSVQFIKAQVVDLDLTADRQRATLSNGDVVDARLVVMATGHGQRLLSKLGIGRTTIRNQHSLAFGFDVLVESPEMFRSSVLVAYGEQPAGAIDYLTIFFMGEKLRANLFTYGDHRDLWTKQFAREPTETLREAMPIAVNRMTGRMLANGRVQVRVNDLKVASNVRRDGLVLVGDAFQTSCPAAGTGIGRVMNDIDRLCRCYIPQWLTTEGMSSKKIGQFYDDLPKRLHDAEALRLAEYRRSLTIATSLGWRIHRQRVAFQNQFRFLARRAGIERRANHSPVGMGMAPVDFPPPAGNDRNPTSRILAKTR
jgi:2-polyprenyl-6-methoxyphenol hydroxylase-like FAD-dependent oxidoreductase